MSLSRSRSTLWTQMWRDPALFVWAIHILLIPLYVFKSGLPQPGDMFIVILVPVALYRWDGKLPRTSRDVFRPLLWFTVWVCLVDYTWAIATGNFKPSGPDSYLLYPIYYVYNALVFLVAFVLYRRHGDLFLKLTVYAVVATVFVQTFASFAMRSTVGRGTLFFNNPNQLGYYALLAATLISLTHRRLGFKLVTAALVLTCCGYLAVVSASRAATAGIAILLIFMIFSNPRVIILACVVAGLSIVVVGPVANAIEASEQRVLNRNNNHLTFFEERGYDRIWQHPEYLLLGAGEGGLSRFESAANVTLEIHSSAGTVVFSYGIVGTLLFLVFGWRVMRGARRRAILMLVPPMLYTIAHQGLRFTLLWVVLAIFVVLKDRVAPVPIRRDALATS